MKQTAVEWLSEQLQSTVFYTDEAKENIINQAKEMEKEQKHSEYMRGWYDGVDVTK